MFFIVGVELAELAEAGVLVVGVEVGDVVFVARLLRGDEGLETLVVFGKRELAEIWVYNNFLFKIFLRRAHRQNV